MSTPIRVLHVLGRLDRGGAETMVMNLYRHMDRQQVQFDFLLHTAEQCSYSEEVEGMGGRIYSISAFGIKTALRYRNAWKAFLISHPEYKILHSHVRSTASLYLPIAGRMGITTIIHSHNTSSGSGGKAVVKNLLQYPLRYQADYLFACGKQAGVWLFGEKACASERFVLLPNAIDLERFRFSGRRRQEVRAKLGLSDQTLAVVHIGRFEEQKNHAFLIKVFKAIHRMVPDSVLFLIGEGPLVGQIKTLVTEQQVEQAVRFLGIRKEIDAILQGMDVMVFPSLYEGLPVTVIEAQAAGLPVILSENVTREVLLTGLAERISLQEGADAWAGKAVLAAGVQGSRKPSDEKNGNNALRRREQNGSPDGIRAAGYDIKDTAEWLTEFYRQHAGGR